MATDPISYDKAELRSILRSFKAMDDEAVQQARTVSNELAGEVGQNVWQLQTLVLG